MEVRSYVSAQEFWDAHQAVLLEREPENILILSLLLRLAAGTYKCDNPSLVAMIQGDRPVLLSLRTPPYYQILAHCMDAASIPTLVDWLALQTPDLPGVLGPKNAVAEFCRLWERRTGKLMVVAMAERIHCLYQVESSTLASTSRIFRPARQEDAELLAEWAEAFDEEAKNPIRPPREDRLDRTKASVAEGRLFVIEDQGDVGSCAQLAGSTPNGRLINFVYTPPAQRRRGCATEIVARLSQLALDRGATFCALYTDLANPTSNSIYAKIGYRPVIDVDMART